MQYRRKLHYGDKQDTYQFISSRNFWSFLWIALHHIDVLLTIDILCRLSILTIATFNVKLIPSIIYKVHIPEKQDGRQYSHDIQELNTKSWQGNLNKGLKVQSKTWIHGRMFVILSSLICLISFSTSLILFLCCFWLFSNSYQFSKLATNFQSLLFLCTSCLPTKTLLLFG